MSFIPTGVAGAREPVTRIARPLALALAPGISAAIILAGCAATSSEGRVPAAGVTIKGIAWSACNPPGPRLQCARIGVPLDWDHPRGRMIKLAVIRHRASNAKQRLGTLFINPGGPGDTGVGLVRGDPEGVDALGGGRFDVVSWDPRGTNASTRVRCFRGQEAEAKFWAGASIPTTLKASRHFRGKIAALARRCGRVSGWLLPHISTADTARDLDYLRRLVGERHLTYVGFSYGTYLGQTYANMFPGRIRAMLLDGIVDPVSYSKSAEARVASQAAGSDEVFDRFLSLCARAGRARCALDGGTRSPAERVERLFARVKRKPITSHSSSKRLTYSDLLLSQFQPLRAPAAWPKNAADLAAALRGDGSALETGADGFLTPAGWNGATTSSAISCADAPARGRLASWPEVIRRLDQIDRLQGRVTGWWLWAPCAAWPVRGQDTYRGPWRASTPNPILLIGTRHDPNTPYGNAVRAAHLLGNAVLLTHDGYGHVSFQDPSACVEKATTAYLVQLITPPRGTVCPSDRQPFAPDFGQPPR